MEWEIEMKWLIYLSQCIKIKLNRETHKHKNESPTRTSHSIETMGGFSPTSVTLDDEKHHGFAHKAVLKMQYMWLGCKL